MKYPTTLLRFVLFLSPLALIKAQTIPSITGFVPSSGTPEQVVTITGTGFSAVGNENIVFFGPVQGKVASASESRLDVIVPYGATNHPVTVTVNGRTAYSRSPFTITFPFSGNITGSFSNRTDFWGGYQLKWQTVCDIDGDGRPDILLADEGSNAVVILRNISTPGALTWDSFDYTVHVYTGILPYALATGDIDGDGRQDVVVTSYHSSAIVVLRNISSPGLISFELPVEFETAPGSVYASIGDLDVDGRPDVAVACNNNFGEGFVSVLRNTSTRGTIHSGSFAPAVHLASGNGGVWFAGICDFDADGRGDIIASNGGEGRIAIFRNASTPGSLTVESFEPGVAFPTGAYPAIVATSDLDGDGKPDLAVGNAAGNSISLFRNVSTEGAIDESSFEKSGELPGSGPWNITAGDVDGDGKPELLVRQSAGAPLAIFKNRSLPGALSDRSFSIPYGIHHDGLSLGISVADLDGDGKSDITVSNESSNIVSVFRNEDLYVRAGPSALRFTDVTGTSLTASFAASPDSPDGYIGIRRAGSFPDPPANGIAYSVGQQIGDDSVVYIGPGTSFRETQLSPGTEYFYRIYAYYLSGATPEYVLSTWAENIAFTIGPDLGPIVTASPEIFSMDDEVTITFDATRSHPANALLGASTISMRTGVVTDGPDGTAWNPNYTTTTYLTPVGNDKWAVTFVPRYLYYVPRDVTVYKIGMIFHDEEWDKGFSFDGKYIYLNVAPTILKPPTALPATFVSSSGFVAEWMMAYDIYEYFLDVSTSEAFDTFVAGYENKPVYGWGTIRSTVSGLAPETQYYYRVRASGIPESSAAISVTTAGLPPSGPENLWLKTHGGPGNDEIQSMTSDNRGNVYAAGHFTGTVTFGSITLQSKGEYDVFFVKYDKDGNVRWARSVGGHALDNEVSLATDSRALYMSAQFHGEIDVDPGPRTKSFFNEGQWWVNDMFFAKYSLEDGSLIWANKIVDAFGWSSSSIDVDPSGVYLSGQIFGRSDFDPSENELILESLGAGDIFVAKYSLRGDLIWAKALGGYYDEIAWGLMVDVSGVYIHGYYNWQCDFDPGPDYHYLEDSGGFFGRYDTRTGNLIYAKKVGNGPIYSISKNKQELYLSGEMFGRIDADPDEGVHLIGHDYYPGGIVARYDLLTGGFHWAQNIVTTDFIGPRKIIADKSGAYVSGYVAGSADFQPGSGEFNRTITRIDAFVARYAAAGDLAWVKTIGSPGYAVSIAATVTNDAYYLGGLFGETVNFDPYRGNVVRTSSDAEDIFIASYRSVHKRRHRDHDREDIIPANGESKSFVLFPNPVETTLSVDWSGFDPHDPIQITILDVEGNVVGIRQMSAQDHSLDVASLRQGYYFMHIRQRDFMATQRFMKK